MADKLTPQQQQAVLDRGGKLLVSAAAGSGKTKVLVDRLLCYIMDPVDPANVNDFLIITYTKAAASELRGKIAAKLTQLIAENPENRHLQRQLQRLYLAKISTVHSFCADILREYAYRADVAADFRVADESECLELQAQVLDKILNNAYETASESPDFCAFIDTQGFGRDDRTIPQIILKVFNNARCHLDAEKWLQWCLECAQTDEITDVSQTVWGTYLIEDLHQYLGLHLEALDRCCKLAGTIDGMQKPAALLADTVYQLKALRQCMTWDDTVRKMNIDFGTLRFPKNCASTIEAAQIKAVRNACKTGLAKKLRAFSNNSEQVLLDMRTSNAAARGLITLVRAFSVEYDRAKRGRRVLDFGDLEHKTLDLLLGKRRNGPTVLASEIGSRFREIMVDEYQDSNAVQDAIFNALTNKRNNCFMVGDVKQSIYQFRLADPGIFIEKYNQYTMAENAHPGEGRKILLSSNFRSCGHVISAVNDVFSNCMSPEVGGLYYGQQEQLNEGIPHQPIDEPEVELHGIRVREDTYAEEAAFVADRITALLDGTHMVRDSEGLRPIKPEDIVILLRSPGSVGAEFAFALTQRGIHCTNGSSVDILQTEEVSTLHAILQIISNPKQDIPLLAALTSKVFGFTADDLAVVRVKDRRAYLYEALRQSTMPKAQMFVSCIDSLRQAGQMLTLSQLVQQVFVETHLDSIYGALPDGEEKTGNLQLFCQCASDYEATGQKDLYQFLEHLSVIAEKGLIQTAEQIIPGAVTIMSIHKSKGLEFPVVFLCGLSRSFNQESTRAQVLCDKELGLGLSCVDTKLRVRYPSVAKSAIAAKMTADSISEEMRVLYVAMTRPKDRLIMTYAVKNLEADLEDIALRYDLSPRRLLTAEVDCPGGWVLQTAMKRTEAGAFFDLGENPNHTKVQDHPWLIQVNEGTADEAVLGDLADESRKTLSPDICEKIRASLNFNYEHESAVSAPSKQTATQLKGRDVDQEIAEDTRDRLPSIHKFRRPGFAKAQQQGIEYGNAIHIVMQHIRYEACAEPAGITAEIQRMVTDSLLTSEQAQMVDVETISNLFATEIGKKLLCTKNILREFKFSILDDGEHYIRGMKDEQILLQGVVDCALVEPDGITVIDFKTDYVTEETLNIVAARYRSQVQVYAHALERIYQKNVNSVLLYFFRLGRFVALDV